MPFDAVFLSAVIEELSPKLLDGRIEKINQPSRDTLILQFRTRESHARLLLTANPNHPRLHITELAYENPQSPPMFCMLLRKHLSGGRLLSMEQPPMERAAMLRFACTDELGDRCEKTLAVEMIGGASNVLLIGQDGRIIDCMRRVDMEAARPALPGLFYRPPCREDRLDPTKTTADELFGLLSQIAAPKRFDKWLLEVFAGFSPLIAREISFSLTGETDTDLFAIGDKRTLAERLYAILSEKCTLVPTLLSEGGRPKDFSFRQIGQYGDFWENTRMESFSALLDEVYGKKDLSEKLHQRSLAVYKTVSNLYDRTVRKLAVQRQELEATHGRERTRQLGDIVTANLHRIARGQTVLSAEDFYDPDMKQIEIPLSASLSPQQNASKFYKDYAKAKTAEKVLTEQIRKGEQEQEYLGSILDELARAETDKDLQEIRQELIDGGYLHERGQSKRMKTPPARPMEFLSSDGFAIFVGRNNRQNDQLTTKAAAKRDIWLHAQKIHGSHVIIVCDGVTPPDETVTEAMHLAAFYSQGREGTLVPVDYCPVKNVKKPAGAKPGMVVYEHYSTGYVTPDKALIDKLRK